MYTSAISSSFSSEEYTQVNQANLNNNRAYRLGNISKGLLKLIAGIACTVFGAISTSAIIHIACSISEGYPSGSNGGADCLMLLCLATFPFCLGGYEMIKDGCKDIASVKNLFKTTPLQT